MVRRRSACRARGRCSPFGVGFLTGAIDGRAAWMIMRVTGRREGCRGIGRHAWSAGENLKACRGATTGKALAIQGERAENGGAESEAWLCDVRLLA